MSDYGKNSSQQPKIDTTTDTVQQDRLRSVTGRLLVCRERADETYSKNENNEKSERDTPSPSKKIRRIISKSTEAMPGIERIETPTPLPPHPTG